VVAIVDELGPAIRAPQEREVMSEDGVGQFAKHSKSPPSEAPSERSGDTAMRDGHLVPWKQNAALTVWCVVLLLGYAETRVSCSYGVPRDCKLPKSPVEMGDDLQTLLLLGLVLALFTGLHLPARFGYIFNLSCPRPRGVAFLGLFFSTPPLWGLLDFVFPHFSFSEAGITSPYSWSLMAVAALGLVALLAWHLRAACVQGSGKAFLAYAAPRVVVLGCFLAFNAVVPLVLGDYKVHVHHYMIAFVVASLAEFNHPISLAVLAISAGVFVQGIAAYNAAAAVELKPPQEYIFNFRCNDGAEFKSPAVNSDFAAWAANNSCALTCAGACIA
jgi:hypothetical protein